MNQPRPTLYVRDIELKPAGGVFVGGFRIALSSAAEQVLADLMRLARPVFGQELLERHESGGLDAAGLVQALAELKEALGSRRLHVADKRTGYHFRPAPELESEPVRWRLGERFELDRDTRVLRVDARWFALDRMQSYVFAQLMCNPSCRISWAQLAEGYGAFGTPRMLKGAVTLLQGMLGEGLISCDLFGCALWPDAAAQERGTGLVHFSEGLTLDAEGRVVLLGRRWLGMPRRLCRLLLALDGRRGDFFMADDPALRAAAELIGQTPLAVLLWELRRALGAEVLQKYTGRTYELLGARSVGVRGLRPL